MQRLVDRFYFWFCFVSATNYNLFDRNSAKYKNINNDIMCFLLCCWCRETVAFSPFLSVSSLCLNRFSRFFCLTFIDALWPTHSQTNRIESSANAMCEYEQEKRAEKQPTKLKITGSISCQHWWADELVFFFLVFQTLSFIQIKSFMWTQANKKHNAPQNNLFVNTMEIFASVCTTHNHVLCLCLICFDHNQSIYGSHTAFTVYTYIRSIPLMVEWKWNVSSYI